MNDELELPSVEVIIRVAGSDTCLIAFFRKADGGVDVVVGIEKQEDIPNLQAALRQGAEELGRANWQPLSGLRPSDDVPF